VAANIPLNDGTGSRSARSLEIGSGIHHQMFAAAAQLRLPTGSTLTRPANTTAYAVGDAISNNATAGSVTAVSFTASDENDSPLIISAILCHTTDTGFKNKVCVAELFQSDPTASTGIVGGDNAAYSTKKGTSLGTLQGTFEGKHTDGAVARFVPMDGQFMIVPPTSGAKTLYLLVYAADAITPSANSTTLIFTIESQQGRGV
jgi:hypothetical protein